MPGQTLQSPLLTFAMGVNGNTVYAKGNIGVNCSGGSVGMGGGLSLTGQIASDGTFLLTNAAEPLDSIQVAIQGKVPAEGSTTWAGSFTVTNALTETSCNVNVTSNFVATPYSPLNGTYAGTITGPKFGSGITVTTQITQEAFTSAAVGPLSVPSFFTPLSATMTVKGSPSLTSGTTTASQVPAWSSSITGDAFLLTFLMNDGSTLVLSGWFTDSSESTLQVMVMTGFGSTGSGGASDICTLIRQ
jgi:hypothetical protein